MILIRIMRVYADNKFISVFHTKFHKPAIWIIAQLPETIEALKKEYRDDITIFLALEMEYFPGIFEPTIEKIRQYPMDYLLLAQHFFYENESFISVRKNWTDEMHLKSYVDLLTNALDTGYFNIASMSSKNICFNFS